MQQQAALSGALGPEAQAQAFSEFQEDPGTQFLREQGLRLIESGAGATGGLGGGERLRELTRFSQGLALQDLSNRFNRLGTVTGTGLTAAQALGGVSGTAAAGQSQALQAAGAGSAAGIVGQAAGLRTGLQAGGQLAAMFASDIRLKTNIKKIGALDSGINWYSWEWNHDSKELFGKMPTEGVIAQEVEKVFPDAVQAINGVLHVDYSRIN